MIDEPSKKRIVWLDEARGLAMLLIVLSHISQYEKVNAWPLTVGVPLFFFLSGFTYKVYDSFPHFLRKKIKGILVPYFSFGVFVYICLTALSIYQHTFVSWSYSIHYYFSRLLIQKRFTALWFSTCLFCMELFFYPVIKYVKNGIIKLVISLAMFAVGYAWVQLNGSLVPWNIDISLTGGIFFLAGFLYKENQEEVLSFFDTKGKTIAVVLISLAVSAVAMLINWSKTGGFFNMYPNWYRIVPVSYLAAFSGIFAVVSVCRLFSCRALQYLGRYSITYYACHSLVMIPVAQTILHRLNILRVHETILEQSIYDALIIVLVVILCTILNLIISKTRLKFMLGK